jgi:hypothetical protein
MSVGKPSNKSCPPPNQASRPSVCYREVVSALGFPLGPELPSLDRPLNQPAPDAADSQLERTALVPPAWRASLYPHRFAVSTRVERELIETIAIETAPKSASQISEAHVNRNPNRSPICANGSNRSMRIDQEPRETLA